jgi:hypothetical protein
MERAYLLNISVTKSISCSAAAIFSAEEGCGRPNPNNEDILAGYLFFLWQGRNFIGGLGVGFLADLEVSSLDTAELENSGSLMSVVCAAQVFENF